MDKLSVCHYCGDRFEKLTAEHFLPKKFMALTGDLNRKTSLIRLRDGSAIEDQFPKMHLSACDACHGHINLTSDNIGIKAIDTILCGKRLSVEYTFHLLNLFDKIRTGYWIFYHHMQGKKQRADDPDWLSPIFPIKERIGARDRSLYVAKLRPGTKGLSTIGVNVPIFDYTPCSLMMVINDFVFLSSSAPYFLHRNFGMRFPINQSIDAKYGARMTVPSLTLDKNFNPSTRESYFLKIFDPKRHAEKGDLVARQAYSMFSNSPGGEFNSFLGTGKCLAIEKSGNVKLLGPGGEIDFGTLGGPELKLSPEGLVKMALQSQIEICSIYEDSVVKNIIEIQQEMLDLIGQ